MLVNYVVFSVLFGNSLLPPVLSIHDRCKVIIFMMTNTEILLLIAS